MKYKGRRDEDVPAEAIEAARVLPPTPGLGGLEAAVFGRPDRSGRAPGTGRDGYRPDEPGAASSPIRSTDVLPGKPVHKRGHRV